MSIVETLLEKTNKLAEQIEKNLVRIAREMGKEFGAELGGYVMSGGEKYLVTELVLTDKGKLVVHGARVRLNGTANKKSEPLKSWKPVVAETKAAPVVAKRRGRPPKIASDTPVAGNA